MTIQKIGGQLPEPQTDDDEEVEVKCRECDRVVYWKKGILRWLGEKAVVCDPCCEKFHSRDTNSAHYKRAESFKSYCPKLYQEIIENSDAIPLKMRALADKYNMNKGLVIHGPSGTFKTTTLWLIVKNLWIRHNIRATFKAATELAREVAVSFDKKNGYEDLIQNVSTCVFLVIDDLGKERMTPRVEEAFFEIFNLRLEAKRPILCSTNFVGDGLAERFIDPETAKAFLRRIRDYMDLASTVTIQEQLEIKT